MTDAECVQVLKLYNNWNTCQRSVDLLFNGRRTAEDDILDARRELIMACTRQLEASAKASSKAQEES